MNEPFYTNSVLPNIEEKNESSISNPIIEDNNNIYSNYNFSDVFLENILKINRGKIVTCFMTYPKESIDFTGILEAASKDYIILSDPKSGKWHLILCKYLTYFTFQEKMNYNAYN